MSKFTAFSGMLSALIPKPLKSSELHKGFFFRKFQGISLEESEGDISEDAIDRI